MPRTLKFSFISFDKCEMITSNSNFLLFFFLFSRYLQGFFLRLDRTTILSVLSVHIYFQGSFHRIGIVALHQVLLTKRHEYKELLSYCKSFNINKSTST